MIWIAPSEKDAAAATLEKRLWDSADQFRANSGLKAQEYSGPILGIIFLRFAEVRFALQRAKLEKASASSRRGSRVDEPAAYHAEGILYLAPNARFDFLLNLPEAQNIGAKVNDAMRDIEKHNPQLAGVLPKTYNLFTSTLLKELLKKVSEIPATVDYDAFGRIYEYFLGEFARTEGQKGGEFYTPSCIVRLLTEIIEPCHGRILDPACGSGGMFVSSARFVAEHKKNPSAELSVHGVEKTDETGRLCRLNLAVHGLEGDIRHGGQVNSYYDDPHDATSRFDFVLANPPFNVNAVDKERLKDSVGPARRFPFGLPRTDNATATRASAKTKCAKPDRRSAGKTELHSLWSRLFHSALNEKGSAGFVMANSASDARASVFFGLSWPAGIRPAVSRTHKPTSIELGRAMKSICGEAMKRSPTPEPRPMKRLKTLGGEPASTHRCISTAAMTGVLFDGLSNTVLPLATAAPAMPQRGMQEEAHQLTEEDGRGQRALHRSLNHLRFTSAEPTSTDHAYGNSNRKTRRRVPGHALAERLPHLHTHCWYL